jgi:hypothetical protein
MLLEPLRAGKLLTPLSAEARSDAAREGVRK